MFQEYADHESPQTVQMPPARITVRPIATLADFKFDDYNLSAAHQVQLKQLAAVIVRTPSIRALRLVGHTDDIGSQSYNGDLGLRRAREVHGVLERELRAVSPTRRIQLIVQSLGQRRPAASNATPQGRSANRRVVIYATSPRTGGTRRTTPRARVCYCCTQSHANPQQCLTARNQCLQRSQP